MILDLLWTRTWWRYRAGDPADFSLPYHAFNLFEGGAWVVFSALVLVRCARSGKRPRARDQTPSSSRS